MAVWNEKIWTCLQEHSYYLPSISQDLSISISQAWDGTARTAAPLKNLRTWYNWLHLDIFGSDSIWHLAANETLCHCHSFPIFGLESSAIPSVRFPKGMQTYRQFFFRYTVWYNLNKQIVLVKNSYNFSGKYRTRFPRDIMLSIDDTSPPVSIETIILLAASICFSFLTLLWQKNKTHSLR